MNVITRWMLTVSLVSGVLVAQKTVSNPKSPGGSIASVTIDGALQHKVEALLDTARGALGATDVLAMVMESDTGRIMAMAGADRKGEGGLADPKCAVYSY